MTSNLQMYRQVFFLLLFFFPPISRSYFYQAEDVGVGEILIKHFTSITIGRKERLKTLTSDSLRWYSSDTNIVTVNNSIIKAESVGTAKIYVMDREGSNIDTCAITVVPWISGITNLNFDTVFTHMELLAIRNDTLYMQGAGGNYGWSAIYFFRDGMGSPKLLYNFPNDNTFDFDREHLLPTTFGNFIIAKRESTNAPRKIYKTIPDSPYTKLVYDKFPPYPLQPNRSYVMVQGWDYDSSGNVYLGEYTSDNDLNYQIRIFKGSNFGENWQSVYTFPPRYMSGNDGGIRHVHACQVDPHTGDIWIATGDGDSQSRIYYNKNQLLPDTNGNVILNLLGVGSQEFRVVSFAFTRDYIYWFMDAPCNDQKMFRIKRAASYYPITSTTPADSDYREIIGVFKDKPFYNNVTIKDSNTSTILIETVYENAALYGCSFRELDDRSRIFGIRENIDGTLQIQEIYSTPALERYGKVIPIGVDSKGYIYFYYLNNSRSIYRTRLKWNDCDDLSFDFPDSVINLLNTKIKLYGNFQGKVRVLVNRVNTPPDSGKLPDNIKTISSYYWETYFYPDNFVNRKICIPISELNDFKVEDSLTWLGRSNAGSNWWNIGGIIQNGTLISDQVFSSFSEFAIASYKEVNIVQNEIIKMPNEFVLYQNYPNPFNNSTVLSFDLPFGSYISLKIYNVLGVEVATLVGGHLEQGKHQRIWDASNFSSGVYTYRLDAVNKQNSTKTLSQMGKMILLK